MLKKKGYDLTKDTFTRMRFLKEGGITHYVGLVTHDAGGRDLRPDRPLKPGMVFACDVFATYPDENLGVRVENTVLITETGCEVLNPGIPREIDEIENFLEGIWKSTRHAQVVFRFRNRALGVWPACGA